MARFLRSFVQVLTRWREDRYSGHLPEEESKTLSTADASVEVLVAQGTGGRLELRGNCLRLIKGGAFGFFVELLGIEGGFVERTIRVSDISAVELDKPALFFRYVRFSYPGSPPLTGNDVEDMMAENALIMSLFDNRNLYRIKERIERSMDRQVGL